MVKEKSIEFKEMSKSELDKLLEEKQAKMTKLRFDISSKQIKNHREHRKVRKDIARILTRLNYHE